MSGIEFNVDQALAKLGDMVAKHGPDAVNLAAEVVRINAVNELVGGVSSVVFLAGPVLAFRWLHTRTQLPRRDYMDDKFAEWLGIAACSVVAAGLTVNATCTLLDVWNWVALFNPHFALAHEVFAKLTGGR